MPYQKCLEEKVSCVLLSYNHVHTIEDTVKSVLKQKLKNFEFIISDDCSNDGTWEKLISIKKKNNNIILRKTKTNIGMAGNTNYAFSLCSRPYIALLHHDDLYPSNLLEEWGKMLEKYSEAAFVLNSYKNNETNKISTFMPSEILDGDWLVRNSLFKTLYCVIRGTCMIRKSAFYSVGGMNEKFGYLADIDLWIKLAKKYSVCFSNKVLITVKTDRPKYYSEDYNPFKKFWKKKKLLYDIYLENIKEYKNSSSIKNKLLWYRYLFNVNKDIIYWIIYHLYKKNIKEILQVRQIYNREEILFVTKIFIKVVTLIIKIIKK
jgi:glycosyltransferase involved in cell wall biosynthesis